MFKYVQRKREKEKKSVEKMEKQRDEVGSAVTKLLLLKKLRLNFCASSAAWKKPRCSNSGPRQTPGRIISTMRPAFNLPMRSWSSNYKNHS